MTLAYIADAEGLCSYYFFVWPSSKVVMQRIANPLYDSSILSSASKLKTSAFQLIFII